MSDEEKRGPGQPTLYRPEYCDLVIEEMAKGYSLGAFAGTVGVSRATINVWMAQHPEFLEATSRAKAARQAMGGLRNAGKEDWVDEKNVKLSGAVGTYKRHSRYRM